MSLEAIGIIGLIVMLILMFFRIPIAIAMAVPAFIGIMYLRGWNTFVTGIETIIWKQSFNYTLSTIPMFILMGELLYISGISSELFNTFRNWMGRLRGGLGIATIGASAIFAAASGSSLATAGTMGTIASKEMLRYNYDKSLASSAIVAGGTLGVMIPPSTLFIIYGMLTEQSIGQLLIAGLIPGIVLALLYMITIYLSVLINPKLAPMSTEKVSWKTRFTSLKSTIWVLILFGVVIGGMYLGWYSPTEAAGIGAFGSFVIALVKRKLTWATFIESLSRTLRTTGFLFAILLSAFILNYFLIITRVPILLMNFLNDLALPAWGIFALIIIMYLLLGAVMDTLAMVVVTIPIILPIIDALGFDLIWFGVIIVICMEMGQITPPLGMIAFVLNGVAPDLGLNNIFKGAARILVPMLVLIVILYLLPELATFLPSRMY